MGLPDIKVGANSRAIPGLRGARYITTHALTPVKGIVFLVVLLVILLLAGGLSACKNTGTSGTGQTQQPGTGEEEAAADGAVIDENDDVNEEPSDNEDTVISFEILGWEVVGETDRAYLVVDFSCDGLVSLALADSSGVKTSYFRQVTEGQSSVRLPLTSSTYETPQPGKYSVIVHTWTGEPVTTVELTVTGETELSVQNVFLIGGIDTPIEAVVVSVENEGNLPAYVASADVWIEDSQPWVGVDKIGILPGETSTVNIELYTGVASSEVFPVEVDMEFKDSMGQVLVTHHVDLNVVPMQTYADQTWDYALTYPVGWIVTQEGSSLESLLTIEEPTSKAWIIVEIQKRPGYQLIQWVDEINNTRQDEWYSYEVLTNEEVNWHGFEAREITWVGQETITSEVLRCHEICFAYDVWKYSIRGVSTETNFSTYAAQLDDIINRFSLFP